MLSHVGTTARILGTAILVAAAITLGVLAMNEKAQGSSFSGGGGGGGGASVSRLDAHFTSNITISDHAFHAIVWDTQDTSSGTGLSFNTSTGTLTVNTNGLLTINAAVLVNTTNSSEAALYISGSGSHEQAVVNNRGNAFGGSSYAYTGCTGSFYATAGDTFTVSYGQQGSGGSSLLGGGGNNTLLCQLVADGGGGGGGGGAGATSWCDLWLTGGGQSISSSSSKPVDWTGTNFAGSALSLATDGNGDKYVAVAASGFLTVTFTMVTSGSETGAIPLILRGTGTSQQQFFNVFASNAQNTWTVSAQMHVLSGDKLYCRVTCPSGSNTLVASTSEFVSTATYATMTFVQTSN